MVRRELSSSCHIFPRISGICYNTRLIVWWKSCLCFCWSFFFIDLRTNFQQRQCVGGLILACWKLLEPCWLMWGTERSGVFAVTRLNFKEGSTYAKVNFGQNSCCKRGSRIGSIHIAWIFTVSPWLFTNVTSLEGHQRNNHEVLSSRKCFS